MSGETNLGELLGTLSATLVDGLFVFATIPDGSVPEDLKPRMVFREAEGTTLILLKAEADIHGIKYEFPCRMITLNVHSSLQAVGFIARIATELTKHNMGVNPVSGFYHDHLFVPDGREQDALKILKQIAAANTAAS
jgi:hypothetical protein